MKKYYQILLFMLLACVFITYCATESISQVDGNDQNMPESSTPEITNIDVDITQLSSTMAYAELYNIMVNVDSYLGKSIKMRGSYKAFLSDLTNLYYHFVVIGDVAACCEIGMEFIWNGEHKYPDDYPAEDSRIEVVGVFGSYEVLGQTRYYLAIDHISNL